jgi:predicted dehydrogenase
MKLDSKDNRHMLQAAILGLGWWGRHITQALRESGRVRVVRAFDPAAEANTFADEHYLSLAPSFDAILADEAIDAVIVATPHALHEKQAVAALAAGKAVFCEKPFAMTAAAARRILAAAEAKGLVLGVGHERRFEPAMEEALAILRSGRQGKLLHMEANVSHDGFSKMAAGNWRHDPSNAPAGAMTGLGVHLTDLFISFAGRPVSLRAATAKKTDMPAAEDFVSCDLRFASGVTGAFTCLSATPYYGRLTVFSQEGWIEARESGNVDRGLPSELVICDKQGERATRTFAAAPTVRANIESWAAAVSGEAPYRFSPDEIMDNARILEGVVWSSRNGSAEVALDAL